MARKTAFSAPVRKLVLGINIGTTYAGMSYCLLNPGKIPTILPVTRFPTQDHVGGDSKVPSVIYYDGLGRAKALDAEALQESVVEQAADEGWVKSEWFKLHLHPGASRTQQIIPPLPANKCALDVIADFLWYLVQCAKIYIQDRYPSGTALWISLEDSMEFVLTHPNGWGGEQQAKMRMATILAGLVPRPEAHDHIHFLGKGVIIVDAGGGKVDISAYHKVKGPRGESFEEIVPPEFVQLMRIEGLFKGSIFVSNHAREHLKAKLKGSKTDEWSYIKFGRPRDRDEVLNILNSQMKLSGAIVARFFKPSLDVIVGAIQTQCDQAMAPVSSILLIGGFAASDWLFSQLKKSMKSRGLEVSRPDSHVNKAVADRPVSFYLDHFVSARISDGIECQTTKLFRESYFRTSKDRNDLRSVDIQIIRYIGEDESPGWVDIDPEKYVVLCTVHADTSKVAQTLKEKIGTLGIYYRLKIDVVLSFGLTELKAQIAWSDNGVEKRGPAELIY
ncbi:hypothetical protein DFH07DRAFT_1023117 [Mycena maculata]|uniref:Actin-like ATPase domain-containing protein n=1 Tax=Mycena maculata TaxID=230809 RepID=A0AAD7J9D0_9AGAR|nr:hypothetical protein DFH07DRAFT_1023117 [Mycena maculata]